MKVINYRVDLLEPALVTSVQGDPNSAVTFDYLPGSVLRGILIGKYLGSNSADASDDTLRRLFFNGTTRYLNGYPLDAYGHPGVPVPTSWQRVKYDKEGEIFDFAVEAQNDKQQWQSVPEPFYTQSGKAVRLILPAHNVAVHTQRTARFGRAMPEYRPTNNGQASGESTKLLERDEIAGAVYRYDALAAGLAFQAAIICDYDADYPILQDLIDGGVTLGGSRSGGYGRAKLSLILADDSDQGAIEEDEDGPENKLIVTLQSDVLLRDARGQFNVDPELLRQVLSRHLQVVLKLEDAFLGTQLVAGFNRKWGLPLPQTLAVRMGSVLVFEDSTCDPTLLQDLEVRGIGDRRAEGFGRIAFNRQRAKELVVKENKRQINGSNNFTISETEARKLGKLIVKRMLRQRLDEGLLAAANRVKIANPPSNAQISRLRGVVLEELRKAKPDIGKIHRFIKGIQDRGNTRRQFERSTLDDKEPLLDWLKRLLRHGRMDAWTMADNDWKALLGLNEVKFAAQIGDMEAEIDNDMRLEYILRLIDLVLAHAAKERGKED